MDHRHRTHRLHSPRVQFTETTTITTGTKCRDYTHHGRRAQSLHKQHAQCEDDCMDHRHKSQRLHGSQAVGTETSFQHAKNADSTRTTSTENRDSSDNMQKSQRLIQLQAQSTATTRTTSAYHRDDARFTNTACRDNEDYTHTAHRDYTDHRH